MAENARSLKRRRRSSYRPTIVVSIVRKDGKVLMIERRNIKGTQSGYAFPGGKVEHDEALSQAAEREVLEETGLYCHAERELTWRVHPTTGAKIHYWLCRYLNRAPLTKAEFPILWTKVEHLDSMAGPTLSPILLRELEQSDSVF